LCDDLRQLLKTQFGCQQAILTDSGTAALHLCLLALREEHPEKAKVLTGAYLCPEVVSAIIRAGLEPVFADTCADSLNVDMTTVGELTDDMTLAIVCTNIGGMPDDYQAAGRLGVPIISDCAQAIGTRLGGRDVATQGLFSILSFGPTKMITAGGGGAVLCQSDRLAKLVDRLAQPELPVEEYRTTGFRATYGQHMGDLTAGLASAQLRRLDFLVDRRREIADSYDRALRDRKDVAIVNEGRFVRSNRFRYYFLTDQALLWLEHLRSREIDARGSISHVIPEYYGNLQVFPRLGRVSAMVVSVPIYPAMTSGEARTVAEALESGPKRRK
jgi:dTDP-4-amino-4,6-dideoxygalactose transaminase